MKLLATKHETERTCMYCRKALIGRTDKKFCSNFCRNTFNNRKNGELPESVRNINNILRKNRRILANVSLDGNGTRVGRRLLEEQGFSFVYHTELEQLPDGRVARYCYDYSYLLSDEGDWVIIRKPSH
jgi:hypothetical protein